MQIGGGQQGLAESNAPKSVESRQDSKVLDSALKNNYDKNVRFYPPNKIFQILESNKDKPLNQDYLFHTMLRLLEIETKDYDKALDILEIK